MKITIKLKGAVIFQLDEQQVPEYRSVMCFKYDGEAYSITVDYYAGDDRKNFTAMCGEWDELEVMP